MMGATGAGCDGSIGEAPTDGEGGQDVSSPDADGQDGDTTDGGEPNPATPAEPTADGSTTPPGAPEGGMAMNPPDMPPTDGQVPAPDGGGTPVDPDPPEEGDGPLVLVGVGVRGFQASLDVDTGNALLASELLCEDPNGHSDPLWRGVSYGGGLFVASGGGFCTGYVQTSVDGVNWGPRVLLDNLTDPSRSGGPFQSAYIAEVAHGNGRWVGAGGNSSRVWSEDGQTWFGGTYHPISPGGPPSDFSGRSIAFGGGRFCVGGDGGDYHFSTDGIDWTTAQQAPDGAGAGRVVYGAGGFVLMDPGGSNASFTWVPDGSDTHTASYRADSGQVRGLAFGAGRFVASRGQDAFVSSDGQSWERLCLTCCEDNYCASPNAPGGSTSGCEFSCPSNIDTLSYAGGRFVGADVAGGSTHVYESTDGINYRLRGTIPTGVRMRDMGVGVIDAPLSSSNLISVSCDPAAPLSDC